MALKYLNAIDLSQNELQNVVAQNLGSDPSTPAQGQFYFNSGAGVKKLRVWNGTSWDQIGVGTVTSINLTAPAAGITVSGGPITSSGSITLALADDLAAVEGLSGSGLAVRTGASTWTNRSIVSGTGIIVSNGDGVSSNPSVATVQDIATTASPTFANVTISNSPTNASHAATKSYVDGLVNGLKWKNSAHVATTSAGTLATSFAAGQTVDGIVLVAGDRILIKNQAAPAENGIYVVAATGAPSRAADADAWSEFISAVVAVEMGTTNADTAWMCTVNEGGTLGTTSVTFTEMPSPMQVLAGSGLVQNGNAMDVNVDNSSLEVNSDVVRVKALGITNAMLAGSIDLTSKVTGALPIANGGTGASSQQAALNALAGAVTSGYYLRGNGTNVVMAALAAADITGTITNAQIAGMDASKLTGTVAAANGGTGQSSYAVGDILYASTTTALSRLADVATGNVLISGGVGAVPTWGKVGLGTHVSGTLGVANGGTGLTSYAVGDLVYASATGTLASLADVATGNVLLSGGVGVAPSYGKVGLTTHVTGTLGVANGGTGATTLTGLLRGNGTGAITGGATVALGSEVSGTLPIANGGTGAVDTAGAKTNLGFVTRFTTTFGDGTKTDWSSTNGIAHGLGTANIVVQFYDASSGKAVMIDYTVTSTYIQFVLPTAPTANQYRVVAIG